MTKSSVLSDDQVIQFINNNFVALSVNITTNGFPPEIRGLEKYRKAYKSLEFILENYFFGHVVVGSDGKFMFGHSGSGIKDLYEISPCYHPDKYLRFLQRSLVLFNRCQKIRSDMTLNYQEKYARLEVLGQEIVDFINVYDNLQANKDKL
ncbi:hypothetical protein [Candidatus Uabimicrobium amorphum]|uniref:Uncharacterized protein n=1 Tax=Uabimicrobium amorphum TaxID=2596890 RepID=A0A5S9IRP2_UABAM|nr:hypothetical protein [Candidatus Uabimicrobium amorphum]BBM86366.1 hypothetical protein UABAM_04752 [Candidatus Uabimicrobium amorphum]